MTPVTRSVADIRDDLRALGLGAGGLVMVHASLRVIGPVEDGADGVIDAIEDAIEPGGTMMMILGARDDFAWVNERPEADRADLLAGSTPFDAAVAPVSPDVGTLAEVFRQRPETVVSDHPEARFAAAGADAVALMADVPWNDYFGSGSPLERLIDGGGKVLRLGADLDTVTALHHAEYLCAIEPKRRVRRHRLVRTADGQEIRVVECLDDEEGIVDYDGDYFADLTRDYLATGRASVGLVGAARSELVDAADIVAFGRRWMEAHLVPGRTSSPLDDLRVRLDVDLLAARREHRQADVRAIRSLKSALANAEAVPLPGRPYVVVEGSAEMRRKPLARGDVRNIVDAEVGERAAAIAEYRRLGLDIVELEQERVALERYRIGS